MGDDKALDALVLAGDRKGARLLYGYNKAFLKLRGKPLISYVISALDRAENVRKVFIIGPSERLKELLKDERYEKPIEYLEQGENIFKNLWYGSLHSFPEYVRGTDYNKLKSSPESEKAILVSTCDIPLLEPVELDHFIKTAPLDKLDLIFGISRKQMLTPFSPKDGLPGIRFSYFVMRDIIFRQANIFLMRPLKLGYVMEEFIPLIYGFRYQTKFKNMIAGFFIIMRLGIGLKALYYFIVLSLSRTFDLKARMLLRDIVRKGVSLPGILEYVQPILKTRFGAHETIGPGPSVDVDSEEDLSCFEEMYDKWKEIQSQIINGSFIFPDKF